MNFILNIPSLLYILVLYNIVAFSSGDASMAAELFSVSLPSEALLKVTWGDLLLLLGTIALYVEILKSTRGASNSSVLEHGLSMALFIVFLIEFILVKQAGTTEFLILTLMELLDVIAGFTISIIAARRDINLVR